MALPLDSIPTWVLGASATLVAAVAWLIKAVLGMEDRFMKREDAHERYFTRNDMDDRYVRKQDLAQSCVYCSKIDQERHAALEERIASIIDQTFTKPETERLVDAHEREAVHTARSELQAAILGHIKQPGHAGSLAKINEIGTKIAVIEERQSEHGRMLGENRELLQELVDTLHSRPCTHKDS